MGRKAALSAVGVVPLDQRHAELPADEGADSVHIGIVVSAGMPRPFTMARVEISSVCRILPEGVLMS